VHFLTSPTLLIGFVYCYSNSTSHHLINWSVGRSARPPASQPARPDKMNVCFTYISGVLLHSLGSCFSAAFSAARLLKGVAVVAGARVLHPQFIPPGADGLRVRPEHRRVNLRALPGYLPPHDHASA